MKSIFLTKTFWLNVVIAIVGSVSTQVPELSFLAKPETIAIGGAILNMIMRLFTHQPASVTGS